jgi:hypothetical protein
MQNVGSETILFCRDVTEMLHLARLDGSSPVNQPAGIAVRKEKGRTTGPAFSHTLHLRTSAATTM